MEEYEFWDEFWMDEEEKAGVLGNGVPRNPEEEAFDSWEWED